MAVAVAVASASVEGHAETVGVTFGQEIASRHVEEVAKSSRGQLSSKSNAVKRRAQLAQESTPGQNTWIYQELLMRKCIGGSGRRVCLISSAHVSSSASSRSSSVSVIGNQHSDSYVYLSTEGETPSQPSWLAPEEDIGVRSGRTTSFCFRYRRCSYSRRNSFA